RVVRRVSTAESSPSACTGCTSFQLFSPLARRATTWPSFESRSSLALALSKSNSFSLFSFASAFFCSSLPVQRATPPMAPATARRTSSTSRVLVVCFMTRLPGLAGLPHHQSREEQPEGQDVEGEERHGALLVGREEQVVALPLLRPDGDARLLLCRPGDRVEREVLVAGEAVVAVGREQRVADHHHAGLGPLGGAGGERDRPLQVLARVETDLARAHGAR